MAYYEELLDKLDEKADKIIAELPDFARKYFRFIAVQKNHSVRTKLQYAYDLKRFFTFLSASAGFRHTDIRTLPACDVLDVLTKDDIQEYLDSLQHYEVTDKNGNIIRRRSSAAMLARHISSLRSFLKYYFINGEINNNLSDLMALPKIHDKEIVVMQPADVQRILSAVLDVSHMTPGELKRHEKIVKRDYAILVLLLGTGLRVSELVGINLQDIDFGDGSILVTRKGGDQDQVYFGDEVESALFDYLPDRDTLLCGAEEDAFFLSMQHRRLSVDSVEKLVKAYAQKANLNIKVTPHSCRKSFGTHVYEETGDIYLVADALHHSSVETTRKHYAKMSREHKRVAAQKASSLLKNDPPPSDSKPDHIP